jgi:hypothetical protein
MLLGLACVPAVALAGLTVEDEATQTAAVAHVVPVKIEVIKAEKWMANAGGTLRSEIMRWADKAGWKVVYESKTDYRLEGDVPFEGRFDEAVAQFIRLYERAEKPLVVDISMKQRLVYITERKAQ